MRDLWSGIMCTLVVGLLTLGCTLTVRPAPAPSDTPAPPAATATVIRTASAPQRHTTPVPTLFTDVEPYDNVTYLLDGVCFEYLFANQGNQWLWQSPADLIRFFDDVDSAELCAIPVQRAIFDFTEHSVLAAISFGQGCDAAHQLTATSVDDAEATITLFAQFIIQPGCDYELVQPVAIAVQKPDNGNYTWVLNISERAD